MRLVTSENRGGRACVPKIARAGNRIPLVCTCLNVTVHIPAQPISVPVLELCSNGNNVVVVVDDDDDDNDNDDDVDDDDDDNNNNNNNNHSNSECLI